MQISVFLSVYLLLDLARSELDQLHKSSLPEHFHDEAERRLLAADNGKDDAIDDRHMSLAVGDVASIDLKYHS